jgi:ADP-heptose:LPS heptosyltransferase
VNATIPIERSKAIYEFKKDFNPNGKIIIHPFAIRDAKAWNLTKYISLAEYLNDNYLVEIVSPPDVLADNIKEEIIKKGIAVTITETIDNLIQKLKECSIFISNDTGPLYIANLLGKATFTIYGPTNPEYSLPFGKYHRFIQKELECSPETGHQFCYTLAGIYCPVYECMNKLDFEEVKNSILAFINDIDLQTKNNPIQ